MQKYTFKKEERLCSVKLIQSLFHNGSSFVVYPFRVVWKVQIKPESGTQVLISVSKRRFKHAVTRNRIKRVMREAYRLEKTAIAIPADHKQTPFLSFALQYIGKQEEASLPLLRNKIIAVIQKLRYESDHVDK